MADQFTPIPVKGLKTHNAATPGTDQISTMPAIASTAAPSLTNGNEAKLSLDTSGNLRVAFGATPTVEIANDEGNPIPISATTAANSATNPLFSQLTNGTAVNPTGSGTADNALRVAPATDVIQQISATTAANTTTNPLFARLTDGTNPIGTSTNPLFVSADASPGTPKGTAVTTASVAAGASTTLNGTAITSAKVGYLTKALASSSVRFKAVVQKFDGTTDTTLAVLFGEANTTVTYEPSDAQLYNQTGNGTTAVFRVVMTNMDNVFAADQYATIEWTEV